MFYEAVEQLSMGEKSYFNTSLDSRAENWFSRDILVHIGLFSKSLWTKSPLSIQSFANKNSSYFFEFPKYFVINLMPSIFHGLRRLVWYLQAKGEKKS